MTVEEQVKQHLLKYSESSGDRGLNMELVSGKPFYPEYPREEDIDIRDVAHSLSMITRYGGQVRKYYSVGQHSVIVSRLVHPDNALEGLMHDAPEYALGDIIRPIKYKFKEFNELEGRTWKIFAKKYGMKEKIPNDVVTTDIRICYTERRDLMNHTGETDWGNEIEPHDFKIRAWGWRKSRRKFLSRFYQLNGYNLAERIFFVIRDEIGYLLNKRF